MAALIGGVTKRVVELATGRHAHRSSAAAGSLPRHTGRCCDDGFGQRCCCVSSCSESKEKDASDGGSHWNEGKTLEGRQSTLACITPPTTATYHNLLAL